MKTWEHQEKFGKKLNIYTGLMAILNSCWYDKTYRSRWDETTLTCLNAYNQCLREHKYFDYSGLLREMIEQLDPDSDTNGGTMSEFGRRIFAKVKYLTIDEYQDTNPAQEYLVRLFKKYGDAKLCVVGDADQTIYQFRGSDESNILEFKDKFQAERIDLNQNFRSTDGVIDIAAVSIGHGHQDDPEYVRMVPGKIPERRLAYETGDAVWNCMANYEEEADFIIDRMQALHALGLPYVEMAVLFRTRNRLNYGNVVCDFQHTLSKKMQDAGIPYIVEGLNLLSTTKEYAAAYGIFVYLYDKICKAYYSEEGETLFGFEALPQHETQEEEAQERLLALWSGLSVPIQKQRLKKAVADLAALEWQGKKFGHQCNMQQIYQDFIGTLAIMGDETEEMERVIYNLGKFSRLIADFELLYFKESPSYKIRRFRRHMEKVADGLYPEGMEDNSYLRGDAVRLMTIHQSKGLEFTAVFVPTLSHKVFPGEGFDKKGNIYGPIDAIGGVDWIPNYCGYEGSVASERKIFYVAVTRAKKFLFLTYAEDYGCGRETESIFLAEARESTYLKRFEPGLQYGREKLPEIEEAILPITLNFSLLSNYFDCPYRFKLSNLYGFVQPYTASQGYGKTLHEIMMHIHRFWIEGKRLDRQQVDEIAKRSLYLPFASEPQLEKSLQGAKKCAWAYVLQNQKDTDKIEAAELDINIEMGQGVSVNGRIDLVCRLDTPDGKEQVAIVDLKSAGKDAEQCLNAEQLKIYAIGYQEMKGKTADYTMIYNLDVPDGSANKGEKVDPEALAQTRQHVLDAADCIRNSRLPMRRGENCKNCYVRGLCHGSGK